MCSVCKLIFFCRILSCFFCFVCHSTATFMEQSAFSFKAINFLQTKEKQRFKFKKSNFWRPIQNVTCLNSISASFNFPVNCLLPSCSSSIVFRNFLFMFNDSLNSLFSSCQSQKKKKKRMLILNSCFFFCDWLHESIKNTRSFRRISCFSLSRVAIAFVPSSNIFNFFLSASSSS